MLALKLSQKIEYPRVWRPILQNVVMAVQADIRTVEALCVALAHDDTDAGRVLEKLLEFLPRSIRNDGAIWKADHYFWTDHRINYRKMVRARRNLKPVMESWKQKAHGAPTWHYHLDPDALVLKMANVLDCSTVHMRMLILQNQNPKPDAEMVKSAKSITSESDFDSGIDSSHSESVVTEIAFLLRGEGLTAKAAAEFAGMNILTARRVIETVRDYDRAGKVKLKAAYLIGALRKELSTLTPNPSPSGRGEQEKYHGTDLIPETPIGSRLDELEARVDEKYQKAWGAAKEQLRLQLDRATYDTWLADVRVMGVEYPHPLTPSPLHGEGESKQTTFVLAVRNERALDMCEGRLHRSVKRILQDTGLGAVDVRFEIAQPLTVNS
jgi:hypothetical protein